MCAGRADGFLSCNGALLESVDTCLKGFYARVACQVIDPLRRYKDVGLEIVHYVGETMIEVAALRVCA